MKSRTIFPCHYCTERGGITIDHIVPRSFGGPDARWNYVAACEPCNKAKGSTWPVCDCDHCQNAIKRFCKMPALVAKAKGILMDRRGDMESGIDSLNNRVVRLETMRDAIDGVLLDIDTLANTP